MALLQANRLILKCNASDIFFVKENSI